MWYNVIKKGNKTEKYRNEGVKICKEQILRWRKQTDLCACGRQQFVSSL